MEMDILLLTVFLLALWLFFTAFAVQRKSIGMSIFGMVCAGIIAAFCNAWIGLITLLFSTILLIASAVGVRI